MDSHQISYDALKLAHDGKNIELNLITAIAQSQVSDSCYAFKSRIKPESRLVEKVSRKQKAKPDYKLTDITDVIGLRLVTLFRRDMPDVLASVVALIDHRIELTPNPFKKGSIEQLIIYSINPAHDKIAHQIKEDMSQYGIAAELNSSSASYSSIHIVARVSQPTDLKYHVGSFNIPVEIQIRTVFEDAWGEIDHKYGYVIRSGKESGKLVSNSSMIQEHLKVLKKFADACAEYADLIYTEASPSDSIPVLEGKVVAVGADDDVLARFSQLGISADYISSYVTGREMRDAALKQTEINWEEAIKWLAGTADYFSTLADTIVKNGLSREAQVLMLYYVRMNEALCLLSTNDKSKVERACTIYGCLEEDYPDFPLVKFRYGQALGKLGVVDASIEKFSSTKKLVEQIDSRQLPFSPDRLPDDDRKHIEKLLPKLLGFQYWVKSQSVDEADVFSKYTYISAAFDETSSLLDKHADDVSVHNNLVYYAVDALTLEGSDKVKFEAQLQASLGFLEKSGVFDVSRDIELLDTLARAYHFLHQHDKSKSAAAKILALWEADNNESSRLSSEVVMDIVKTAFALTK